MKMKHLIHKCNKKENLISAHCHHYCKHSVDIAITLDMTLGCLEVLKCKGPWQHTSGKTDPLLVQNKHEVTPNIKMSLLKSPR